MKKSMKKHWSIMRMMDKKNQETKRCGDCANGEPYTDYRTLSLSGKPTMIVCPHNKWKRLYNDKACEKFNTREK